MIEVFDIVDDSELGAPEPITIIRSLRGQFGPGGFTDTKITLPETSGPVQPATEKEVAMLPVADVVGLVKAFWLTQPIYTVRGTEPVPSTHSETPQGSGTAYSLSLPPPDDAATIIKTGKTLDPFADPPDYTIVGVNLTLAVALGSHDWLYATWPITADIGLAESDILVYNNEQYRVLAVKRYSGSGYWKGYGTRMSPQ